MSESTGIIIVCLICLVGLGAYLWYISDGNPKRLLTDENLRKRAPIAGAIAGAIAFVLSLVVSGMGRSRRKRRVEKSKEKHEDIKKETEKNIHHLHREEGKLKEDIAGKESQAKEVNRSAEEDREEASKIREEADRHHHEGEDALAKANRLREERENNA